MMDHVKQLIIQQLQLLAYKEYAQKLQIVWLLMQIVRNIIQHVLQQEEDVLLLVHLIVDIFKAQLLALLKLDVCGLINAGLPQLLALL